jgi:hypothetical protein
MMLFEIDSVEWTKGASAPCPPSLRSLIQNGGHASAFALRAAADALPPYAPAVITSEVRGAFGLLLIVALAFNVGH